MKIQPCWLEATELNKKLIKPELTPQHNVVRQFGYDLSDKATLAEFKSRNNPTWYHLLGWSVDAQAEFWKMLCVAYKKDKSNTRKWFNGHSASVFNPKNMPVEYVLDGPTNSKECWTKSMLMID